MGQARSTTQIPRSRVATPACSETTWRIFQVGQSLPETLHFGWLFLPCPKAKNSEDPWTIGPMTYRHQIRKVPHSDPWDAERSQRRQSSSQQTPLVHWIPRRRRISTATKQPPNRNMGRSENKPKERWVNYWANHNQVQGDITVIHMYIYIYIYI